MKVINSGFPSIEQVASQYLENRSNVANTPDTSKSFSEIFTQKQKSAEGLTALKFSKHAAGRLSERNIELSPTQMDRLNAGMQAAEEKGIKETLVMVDQLAFIVNVKNQTVITALDGQDAKQNVFTNIDGAVIA